MNKLHYLCLVFVRLSRLFIAALWSPERERADLLALVCDVYCDVVTFPFGILDQLRYLIVSIPDSCCLSYFISSSERLRNELIVYQGHSRQTVRRPSSFSNIFSETSSILISYRDF